MPHLHVIEGTIFAALGAEMSWSLAATTGWPQTCRGSARGARVAGRLAQDRAAGSLTRANGQAARRESVGKQVQELPRDDLVRWAECVCLYRPGLYANRDAYELVLPARRTVSDDT